MSLCLPNVFIVLTIIAAMRQMLAENYVKIIVKPAWNFAAYSFCKCANRWQKISYIKYKPSAVFFRHFVSCHNHDSIFQHFLFSQLLFHFPYNVRALEAIRIILNNITIKTAEQRWIKRGDYLSFFHQVDSGVNYVVEGRLRTLIPESDNTPGVRQTFCRQSDAPNDNTDMVVFCVQLKNKSHLNVLFTYNVHNI